MLGMIYNHVMFEVMMSWPPSSGSRNPVHLPLFACVWRFAFGCMPTTLIITPRFITHMCISSIGVLTTHTHLGKGTGLAQSKWRSYKMRVLLQTSFMQNSWPYIDMYTYSSLSIARLSQPSTESSLKVLKPTHLSLSHPFYWSRTISQVHCRKWYKVSWWMKLVKST